MAKQRRKNVRQNLVKNLMSKKQFVDPKYSKRIVNPSKFDQVKQNSFTNNLMEKYLENYKENFDTTKSRIQLKS